MKLMLICHFNLLILNLRSTHVMYDLGKGLDDPSELQIVIFRPHNLFAEGGESPSAWRFSRRFSIKKCPTVTVASF